MELSHLQSQARAIRARYDELETARSGRSWNHEEIMLGFIGDVGDLSKLVQAKAGIRPTPDVDRALAHELADCLWSIFVLADCYDVDLEAAFTGTMHELSERLAT